jgi:hypothetical protein
VVPLRAKANNLVVQLYADAAAHADDHRLAVPHSSRCSRWFTDDTPII